MAMCNANALRTCLQDVPDNVIFHLKRFDFDLVDMRRTKINDYFEFPSSIDLSPYKVDHLSDPAAPRQDDVFELVGVLVHQGTSENGHYYSYIRERPSSHAVAATWVDFNDRDVTEFDPAHISFQAFGGWYEDQFQRHQKQFSAYMLFYQRRAAMEADYSRLTNAPLSGPAKVTLPPALEESIARDNERFIRQYCLCDPNHSKFMRQLLSTLKTTNHGNCSEDHHQEALAISTMLDHFNEVMTRMRETLYFEETLFQLRKTVLGCPSCCYLALRYLSQHDSALVGLLLRCPHARIRGQMRAFLVDCLRFLVEKETAMDGLDSDSCDADAESGSEKAVVEVLRRLRRVAEQTSLGTRGWDDLYETVCQVAALGPMVTASVLDCGFLEICLEILSIPVASTFRPVNHDLWRLVEKKKCVFNKMIELVWVLLSQMDVNMDPVCGQQRLDWLDRSSGKFPLSRTEHQLLTLWSPDHKALAALDKIVEDFDLSNVEVYYPGEIIKLLLHSEDGLFLQHLRQTIVDGVSSYCSPYCEPYIQCARFYCEACPTATDASQVIMAIIKSMEHLRERSGEAYQVFFRSLPSLRNERFSNKPRTWFVEEALRTCRRWGPPLLLCEEEMVRRNTSLLIELVFAPARTDEHLDKEFLQTKNDSRRILLRDLIRRISHQHQAGTARSHVQSMIHVCSALARDILASVREADATDMRQAEDEDLVHLFSREIEHRLQEWSLEDETSLSAGGNFAPLPAMAPDFDRDLDAYEDSQYASESDEVPDTEP